jgi:N6-L-threonylcarbamoyladenine synthase
MSVCILAIESSCDDTAAAVVRDGWVLSNVVASQDVHRQYGGVVPEVASRAHQEHIVPVVEQALKEAGTDRHELDAIAFTRGPGLMGSLIVGVSFAKGLALSLGLPLIEVHHMQAHVIAHFAEEPYPNLPFLCLTVSGGHTQIVRVNGPLEMEVLGQTLDDAAGEAFDKSGKMLGLDYPAGPQIDRLARQGAPRFAFPEPRVDGLDFSFSGLKTSILYFLNARKKENPDFIRDNLADLCASIQERIVSILINKLEQAALETGITELAISGGVSANSSLRMSLGSLGETHGWKVHVPPFELCTDNAGMIGVAAHFLYLEGRLSAHTVAPDPRLPW